jgi:hypothetical protein
MACKLEVCVAKLRLHFSVYQISLLPPFFCSVMLPSLPNGLSWHAPSTWQHPSLMETWATSSNSVNCKPTPLFPLPGIPPMQKNWGAYAKVLAPVPMRASASKAPKPSIPFLTTRSQPTAAGKSRTPRLFARSD